MAIIPRTFFNPALGVRVECLYSEPWLVSLCLNLTTLFKASKCESQPYTSSRHREAPRNEEMVSAIPGQSSRKGLWEPSDIWRQRRKIGSSEAKQHWGHVAQDHLHKKQMWPPMASIKAK